MENVMVWNDNAYDLWMLLNVAFLNQAVWFAGCAFLIWVGFRFTNNIYNDASTPLLGRVLTTAFCLSVAMFTLGTFMQAGLAMQNTAEAFAMLKSTGVDMGPGADGVIDRIGDAPVNPVQWVFLASVVIMQLVQIWMKKA